MDTKIKAQLYDIVSLANTEENSKLVDIGNVRIREEDIEEYQKLQRQLDIIKPENQEVPITNFPGTDVPRPRFRKTDESNEEYVQFLQEYYSVYFPEANKKTEKKGTEETIDSKEELPALASLDGEEITRDVIEETYDVTSIEDIPGEEIYRDEEFIDNPDIIEDSEAFETETSLMLLEGEEITRESIKTDDSVYDEIESSSEIGLTDEELEAMYDDMMSDLSVDESEDEYFDIEELEVVSVKDIPKKLWDKIKSIPFIGKAIKYLENLVTKNKKQKKVKPTEIENEFTTEDFEQKKDVPSEKIQHHASDENIKNDAKSHNLDDYRLEDNIDKIIINGVEPLTSAFSTPGELFNKVENGTAYNYSDLERTRIENVKDTINPEMNAFFISKIIKQNEDGSIETIKSANKNDLEHLIFEVSNKDIPDYVFARYSGKNIKESLVNQDNIPPKAM